MPTPQATQSTFKREAPRAGQTRYALSLRKAFVLALAIEAAFLLSLSYIDFRKAVREPETLDTPRPVSLEPAVEKLREAPAPKPKPAPAEPRPNRPVARTEPAEQRRQARAVAPSVRAPAPAATPASKTTEPAPSLPAGNDIAEPPGPAATAPAAPAPSPPMPALPAPESPAPKGPRDTAALANRQACMSALIEAYPRDARRAGIEGSLTALVSVEANGHATRVEIVRAKPRRVFERALSDVLMSAACRFTPAPSAYQALIPFEYRLDGESDE